MEMDGVAFSHPAEARAFFYLQHALQLNMLIHKDTYVAGSKGWFKILNDV